MARTRKRPIQVETLRLGNARRRGIPTAGIETVMDEADRAPGLSPGPPAVPSPRRERKENRHAMKRHAAVPPDLLDSVVAYFRPRRVILFGSAARGEARPDSDLDLLVVLDDDAPEPLRRLDAGWEAQRGYRGAADADVIPVCLSTFEKRSRLPGTLSRAAREDGIVVYERP
jgi:hypothetical protein